jgi:hypothetical protein
LGSFITDLLVTQNNSASVPLFPQECDRRRTIPRAGIWSITDDIAGAEKMQKRELGNSNMEASATGLGCTRMTSDYGPPKGTQDVISVIRSAVECSLTFFNVGFFALITLRSEFGQPEKTVAEAEFTPFDLRALTRPCREIEPGDRAEKVYNADIVPYCGKPDIGDPVHKVYKETAIPVESFAAVAFPISKPEDVDVNKILFRRPRATTCRV